MSKVLIKAQTTLDEYGAELPPKRQPSISPEEQEFNFDRAVDASDAPSLNDIYNQPYDSRFASEMIDTNVSDARQKIARDLLEGDSSQYSDHKELLENLNWQNKDGTSRPDSANTQVSSENISALPESLRQYFSRQSKLPEHMPTLHTPNWQMEDGSIRPGSIPPINAVRRMGTRDIDLMMQGAGLVPVHNDGVHDFENHMIGDEYRFNLDREGETKTMDSIDGPKEVSPNELGFFVSPNNKIDVGRAQMDDGGGFSGKIPKGYVGIRGLNTKDDKLQMRPPIGNFEEHNTEGMVQSRIPPSRLVPIRNKGNYPNRNNILYGNEGYGNSSGKPISNNYRNQVDSVINEYPEVWDDVKIPTLNSHKEGKTLKPSIMDMMSSKLYANSTPPSWGDSGRENPMVGVTPRAIENILNKPNGADLGNFNNRMDRHQKYLKRIKKANEPVDSSREAPATLVQLQNGNYTGKPEACTLCGGSPVVAGGRWKNPLGNIDYTHHLCEPCADQYDVHHSADYYKGEDMFIGDVLVKRFRDSLRRKRNLPVHWTSRFDNIEDMNDEITAIRSSSLEDANNFGNVPIRDDTIDFEESITRPRKVKGKYNDDGSPVMRQGAESLLEGVNAGKTNRELVPKNALFWYQNNLNSLAPQNRIASDMPGNPTKIKDVMIGTSQEPDYRGTTEQGRFQTEGVTNIPDHDKAVLLSDPKRPFKRREIQDAARQHLQRMGINPNYKGWLAGVDEENYNTDTGVAVQAMQNIPTTPFNPLNDIGVWGNPRTLSSQNALNEDIDTKVASEPMSVGDVLVKERISPEAIAHKLEYDKKYESNPVRVKYREDLNRERRKRHIYGKGGPDMSHTSQHTIVPEDPHTNRARHFKSKGTLL